ncbi:MAG: AAA family ATPase [Acidobacteriota bacterium]
MASAENPRRLPLTPERLETQLRAAAEGALGEGGLDDLETRFLIEILRRSTFLLKQGYDPETLNRILAGVRRPASLLDPARARGGGSPEDRLLRTWSVPDVLRACGDKCLYDVGLAGRTSFRGFDLLDLGPRSYGLASEVLELLAQDPTLRDFYDRNLVERLPIGDEILFLRQCASRFQIYAQILQALCSEDPAATPLEAFRPAAGRGERRPAALVPAGEGPARDAPRAPGSSAVEVLREPRPPTPAAEPERIPGGPDRKERLTGYEREILLASLDLDGLRRRLKGEIVDQDDAVDQICDNLAVFAVGTRGRPRPQSYLLVGPTGVGKNYLIETLVRSLEEIWGVEVPFLVLEGPQYTHPSDVTELKGSTRGFIRSDEQGILAEFHERTRTAPLSFLLIDEIEKAHPQLARFFLSLMDRGWTMDNRGRTLRFPATVLAYTSNLGYGDRSGSGRPIGYGTRRSPGRERETTSRSVRRGLSPEFLNRLEIIHFAPLSIGSAARIVDQEVGRIASRYAARHGVDLSVTPAAREELVRRGFSEEYGARRLVGEVDRVCNVEVSLRLHSSAGPLTEAGRRLLSRIREARRGERAVDEAALLSEVAHRTRLGSRVRRVEVDAGSGGFVYRVVAP